MSRPKADCTVREGWELPEPPMETCPECGAKPEHIVVHTGDAWYLCWECEKGCQPEIFTETTIDWPFVEGIAWASDFERLGFRIE